MFRRQLGDAAFLSGLREFYAKYLFKHASFSDIQHTFERVCRCALESFFHQWLTRAGAPIIHLHSARLWIEDGQHKLTIVLGQSGDQPWELNVPIRIGENTGKVTTQTVRLFGTRGSFTFELGAPAARVEVDPEIDIFRMLDQGEKPTTFGKVFAADRVIVVAADDAFSEVAKAMAQSQPNWQLSGDVGDKGFNNDVLVLVGWDHAIAKNWFSSQRHVDRYSVSDEGLYIEEVAYSMDDKRVIALVDTLTIGGRTKAVLWIAATSDSGLADLLTRLSHYGRFSYAVFDELDRPAVTTGQWQTKAQTLIQVFDPTVQLSEAKPRPSLF